MKVSIIDGCISCGACEGVCPTVFRMDNRGQAEVYAQPTPDTEALAEQAADHCPTEVIKITK